MERLAHEQAEREAEIGRKRSDLKANVSGPSAPSDNLQASDRPYDWGAYAKPQAGATRFSGRETGAAAFPGWNAYLGRYEGGNPHNTGTSQNIQATGHGITSRSIPQVQQGAHPHQSIETQERKRARESSSKSRDRTCSPSRAGRAGIGPEYYQRASPASPSQPREQNPGRSDHPTGSSGHSRQSSISTSALPPVGVWAGRPEASSRRESVDLDTGLTRTDVNRILFQPSPPQPWNPLANPHLSPSRRSSSGLPTASPRPSPWQTSTIHQPSSWSPSQQPRPPPAVQPSSPRPSTQQPTRISRASQTCKPRPQAN